MLLLPSWHRRARPRPWEARPCQPWRAAPDPVGHGERSSTPLDRGSGARPWPWEARPCWPYGERSSTPPARGSDARPRWPGHGSGARPRRPGHGKLWGEPRGGGCRQEDEGKWGMGEERGGKAGRQTEDAPRLGKVGLGVDAEWEWLGKSTEPGAGHSEGDTQPRGIAVCWIQFFWAICIFLASQAKIARMLEMLLVLQLHALSSNEVDRKSVNFATLHV